MSRNLDHGSTENRDSNERVLEDLSKQIPNLSLSHVLVTKRSRYRSQYHAMHENSKFSNYLKILCLNRDRMRKRNELKEKKRVDSLRSADPGLLVILEKSLRAMALHALEEYKTRRREQDSMDLSDLSGPIPEIILLLSITLIKLYYYNYAIVAYIMQRSGEEEESKTCIIDDVRERKSRQFSRSRGELLRRDVKALLTTHSPVQGSAGEDWTDSMWIKLVSGFTEPNCTSNGNIRKRLPIARRGRFKEPDRHSARAR
ncbi:hypothetical protein ALC53_10950 [Atta colombica]|uniref:Uncharacterized protein n=1 Tax=Atta colombica TaxID=520822 RepID=A0A151HZJ8_9HYME|nr:hypothetical protein ALC53_10950 [Atta colombica]